MHRFLLHLCVFVCGLTTLATNTESLADSPVRRGPQILDPQSHFIGTSVQDVSFEDWLGTQHQLHEVNPDGLTVIAMTSTSCPLSQKYLSTLASLAQQFAADSVSFLVVNPIATDKPAKMDEASASLGKHAAYVFDPEHRLVRVARTDTTTDVVVLDRDQVIRYHGAIDDQYGLGYSQPSPQHHYLADALQALLNGETPEVQATTAPGCTLPLTESMPSDHAPTYHQEISRLMNRRCVTCHREGGVGPFALTNIEDTVAHASMIRDVVQRGVMPPWFAGDQGSTGPSRWKNDCSLTTTEKQNLLAWIDADMPAGDPADREPPPTFPDGWSIGQPDAIYAFAKPVKIKATGIMPYQNITVQTDQSEDRWVKAIEIRPGDRRVVHHVIVSLLPPKTAESRRRFREDRDGYWAAYVPGMSRMEFPDGIAKRLPAGSRLRFQMHYTPIGTATEDTTQIGLKFTNQAPEQEIHVAAIAKTNFSIPPHADNHLLQASIRSPYNAKLIALLPHAHLRGKACRFEWSLPGEEPEVLLDVPHYDFNWQLRYEFADPPTVRKGETLRYLAWYDNSKNNPANPNPDKTVGWGEQTEDEMHLGYVEYVIEK